jgi:hypothetical protein
MVKKKAEPKSDVKSENQPKFIMIGMEYCDTCEEQKELLAKELKSGEIKYVDIDGPDGADWDKNYDIDSTPTFMKLNPKTGKYRKVAKFERPDGTYFFR